MEHADANSYTVGYYGFASALCYRWPLLRTSDARPYVVAPKQSVCDGARVWRFMALRLNAYTYRRHRGRFSVSVQKVEFWGEYCDTENRPLCLPAALRIRGFSFCLGLLPRTSDPTAPSGPRVGASIARPRYNPPNCNTPMQIRTRPGFADLHRRFGIVGLCCGRAMLAPTWSRQSRMFVTGHVFGASWLCN